MREQDRYAQWLLNLSDITQINQSDIWVRTESFYPQHLLSKECRAIRRGGSWNNRGIIRRYLRRRHTIRWRLFQRIGQIQRGINEDYGCRLIWAAVSKSHSNVPELNYRKKTASNEDSWRDLEQEIWQNNHRLKNCLKVAEYNTKRMLLPAIYSIYDILGLASPVAIIAKLLYSEICLKKFGWDKILPEGIIKPWKANVSFKFWFTPSPKNGYLQCAQLYFFFLNLNLFSCKYGVYPLSMILSVCFNVKKPWD